jgi:pilus assembly protein CpaC
MHSAVPRLTLIALAGLAAALPAPAVAQEGNRTAPSIDAGQSTPELIAISTGQSRIIRTPWPATRVSVTDPTVADVEILAPDQVMVMGKKPGATDVMIWNDKEQVWSAQVRIGADVARMQADLRQLFPGSRLSVEEIRNVLVVGGYLRKLDDSKALRDFLQQSGVPFLDKTSVAGLQQVQIRVRVAEVSRSAIRTLGVNTYYSGSDFFGGVQPGPSSGGALNPGFTIGPNQFSSAVSPSITIFGGVPDWDLNFFIQALAENQYLRLLAEPSLNCLSGEKASFLAGGEYPIPVVQGGAAESTSISIEYREFGVRLQFEPVVLGDNTIRMMVAPEVSELTDLGAVTIQGFRVPALSVRRATTTVELKSGQTFVLAGLLQQRADGRNSRIPGFGDLPVIGSLFRSVRYNAGETELVVLATAYLVEPLDQTDPAAVPGDLHVPPNDWELFARGRLAGASRTRLSAPDAAWMKATGLDRLRGPGAWITHNQEPSPSFAQLRPPAEK